MIKTNLTIASTRTLLTSRLLRRRFRATIMKNTILSLIALTVFSVSYVNASEKIKITGIYTNMSYNEEGGDLLGEEIFIIYGGQGQYYATVQCAQGGVRPPIMVKVTVNKNTISFNVPESNTHLCVPGVFKGKITNKGLIGEFTGNHYKVNLPRGNSYWQ